MGNLTPSDKQIFPKKDDLRGETKWWEGDFRGKGFNLPGR